ncbi:TetR/AcrR family transcriptional regulator [Gordonia tangerina]|uniref:TetR/AcrR family transcriptional regulator n=1 Tax=Gordonia tangerina TaxID=2911060 RepID=A0ABS9DIX2_9ACTN|nr:TetR/AcrR family transcriptional regulator [Gordonia tangerina]MCF3937773.1 TetR/AcrR family transcriptional regulator [Gordonia tangerina]
MLPEAVVSSEGAASPVRERLLQAMATCVMERGYRETTVADVVRVARTSRRSFYQEFADKQACFVDLLRTTNDAMIQAISEEVDPAAEWTMQIRQAVEAYVSVTEQNPAIAWSWIRELPALGDSARRVQVDAMESLIAVLVPLTDSPRMREAGISPMTHETAVMIWGGIRELAASAMEQDRSLYSIVEPVVAACIALIGANIRS